MSIGYANICTSVQDYRQKFSVFNSSIGSGRTNESYEFYKEGSLKTRGSEEADVIIRTLLRSCSPEADVIKGYEDHQKLEEWKLQRLFKCFKSHLSLQKYGSLMQRLI